MVEKAFNTFFRQAHFTLRLTTFFVVFAPNPFLQQIAVDFNDIATLSSKVVFACFTPAAARTLSGTHVSNLELLRDTVIIANLLTRQRLIFGLNMAAYVTLILYTKEKGNGYSEAHMTLSEEFAWRGLIKDKTFADNSWLDKPKSFYLGIDASADSLTVGNLAILMLARRLVDAGWKAVLVMGGGTSLVGDPGGKNEERTLMTRESVKNNIEGIRAQVTRLFKGENYLMVDNYEWLSKLKYVDFLRDVGKHFSMTELMQRDFVVERMGEGGTGISYAEFSYSLVQGYDFWHLFKENSVVMQIGGSDQWGNLISGVSLIRKKEAKEAHALSMPLVVNKATGVKFGKSEGGAVWLDPKKTSVHDFYQFWINVDDDSVGDYLKIFTELDKEQIAEIMTEFEKNQSDRLAQETLAYKVTELVHGKQAADEAQRSAKNIRTSTSESVQGHEQVGASVIDVLVKYDLATSKTEARRLLESGGIYINGRQMNKEIIEKADFHEGLLMLRRGKTLRNTVVLKLG